MDVKQGIKKQFGRSSNDYVSSVIHRKGEDLDMMVEMAQVQGEEKLLDVATGGGHTANAFAPLVQTVTAMDLTPEMLTAAKEFITEKGHSNVAFVEGDAEKMPFSDESFDIVTCRIAPHHFPNIHDFISEAHRVLKPGGQFILDDNVAPEDAAFDQFYNSVEKMRDYSHYRAWKKTEWVHMLELNQFEIQAFRRFEKQFEFENWCDRMHLSDAEKQVLNSFMIRSSEKIKHQFRLQISKDQVETFHGEALLLKATKR